MAFKPLFELSREDLDTLPGDQISAATLVSLIALVADTNKFLLELKTQQEKTNELLARMVNVMEGK